MSIKEISTKLTSDELDRFLEICKNRNCTPSNLIKKPVLILIETSEKKKATEPSHSQAKPKPEAAKAEQQASLDEPTIIEFIKKIENDEASEELQELYVKLGEKLEKNSLTKPEETLFRKVHQKLRDMLLKHVAQTKTLNVEERFQYF